LDNIIIEKVWEDINGLEIKIKGISEFIEVYQYCYLMPKQIEKLSNEIKKFIMEPSVSILMKFGSLTGITTPAFMLEILPVNTRGHLKIELNLEIDDNDIRSHRASFYVNTELGLLETFGKRLNKIINGPVGTSIMLIEE